MLLSDVAATRIGQLRDEQKLSYPKLAQRCAELGAPQLTAAALSNIETGRRDGDGKRRREITIDELVVIARALDVAPALLMAPIGYEDTVEVLPGRTVAVLEAYEWLVGESNLESEGVPKDHTAIDTYRKYEKSVLDWMVAKSLQPDEKKAAKAWRDIQTCQATMQSFGWRTPPLPGQPKEATR